MSETLPSLTANGQKLIDRLLTLPQGWVTAAMLAESIGVSRRTVLRELPSVEQWIAAAGYRFVRSPGQGLLLDEPPARREQMRALLNGSTVYAELPRRQRRQKLLGMLLQAREPMKTAALARELLVSESTLTADLDEIGQWVSSYAVTLHRRPGVGVWLKGEKLSCRRAAVALLQSSLTEEELQAVLRGNFAADGAFAALLNTKIAERVWQAVRAEGEAPAAGCGFSDACHPLHAGGAAVARTGRFVCRSSSAGKRRTAVRGSFGTGVRPDAADRGSAVFRAVSGSVYHR